ncbi:polymeric immunoglobulin receptor-like isoform X2 [Dunckerocampus dactyliophorus]|nr:polymeric immunoglobulin receptor-like isoform X2 [Dunckerocampus dactyliophorus]
MREFCSSLARTDDALPGEKVSIVDDPVQQVFTVTMKDMKEDDAGWYMCGVEIGGFWTADVTAFTYIKVTPGMTVVNDRLSGEEGSSVTVECLYTERHRESEKKWCRSGDWNSCLPTGPGGSFEDSSVAIHDDKTGTLTITIKRLQMSDMGWYWCSAGQQNVGVHVQVTPRTSTTPLLVTSQAAASQLVVVAPPPDLTTKDSWTCQVFTSKTMMLCALFMLFVGLAILARRLQKHEHFAKLRQTMGRKANCKENIGMAAT